MKAFIAATWQFFLLVIVGVLPFLVFAGIVGWHDLIKIAIYGFFVAMMATIYNGPTAGLGFALIFAVFSMAGSTVQDSPLGAAALIGLSALLASFCATKGQLRAAIFAAMFIPCTFNPPPTPWSGEANGSQAFLLAIAGVTILGGFWGLFIGWIIKRKLPEFPPPSRVSWQVALAAGLVVAVFTCAVTYYSVDNFPDAKWSWLLATIYSMMTVTTGMTWATSRDLILGTTIGVVIAVAIFMIGMPMSLMVLVGTLVMASSIALRVAQKPLWLATSVSTPGVVLLTGSTMDPFLAAEDRLIFAVAGAIIAVLLGFALTWVVKLATTNEPTVAA